MIVPELDFHQINNRFTTRTYIYHLLLLLLVRLFYRISLCTFACTLCPSSLLFFPFLSLLLISFSRLPFCYHFPPFSLSPLIQKGSFSPPRLLFSSLVSPFTFYDHPSFTGLLAATAPTTTPLIILPLCISFISFALLASLPPSIHQHASQSLSLSTGLFLTLDIAGVPSSFSPHNSTTTQHQCHKVRTTTTSLTPIHPHSRSSPSLPLLLVEKS